MKKEFAILGLIFILMPFVLGVEINLVKESYSGWETLQADITGNFISLEKENVLIYENGSAHSEAVLSGLIKRGDVYKYYAILPEREGNFSLRIEGVQYIKSGKLVDDVVSKDFTIVKGGVVLSVNPGFVITDKDFSVRVVSYNGNQDISATFSGNGQTESLHLVDSVEDKIKFSIEGVLDSESNIEIGSYNIPVYLIKKQNEIVVNESYIEIVPLDLRGSLDVGEEYTFEIMIENSGETNISLIVLSSDLDVLIEPNKIEFIEVGEKKIVNVTLVKIGESGEVFGEIVAEFDGKILSIPISFEIEEGKEVVVKVKNETIPGKKDLYCEDLGGVVCLDNDECDEDTVPALDGPCCLGECVEESDFNWWIIGLLILVLVAGIILVYYKKIKKKQIRKSSDEILNDKSERFKKRMAANKGQAVNKRLERF